MLDGQKTTKSLIIYDFPTHENQAYTNLMAP